MGKFEKNPPQEGKGQSQEKQKNLLMKLALAVLLIIIIILLLLRSCGDSGKVLEPDYNLVEPDHNAQTIPDGTQPQSTETIPQGGGSMSLVYSDQVSVNLSTGKVGLYYQNPSDSSHSIVVQIIIQRDEAEYLVAESGSIDPGYMLTELTAEKGLELAEGVYKGVIKLLFFNPETGERALVDTNIPADITVQS